MISIKKNNTFLIYLTTIIILIIVVKVFFLDIASLKESQNAKRKIILIYKIKPSKKNILVLYKNPFTGKKEVSRLVAQAGDTVLLNNGVLFVNNIKQKNKKTLFLYRINTFSEKALNLLKKKYQLIENDNLLGVYYLNLRQSKADSLKKDSIFVIKKELAKKGNGNKKIFPQSFRYRWNEDNFGPLRIIKKGDIIKLNDQTYSLFKNTLKYFEGVNLEHKNNKFFIAGKQIKSYKFTKNYVFLLNDKRSDFNDSRIFGMIPVKNILGKILLRK